VRGGSLIKGSFIVVDPKTTYISFSLFCIANVLSVPARLRRILHVIERGLLNAVFPSNAVEAELATNFILLAPASTIQAFSGSELVKPLLPETSPLAKNWSPAAIDPACNCHIASLIIILVKTL
jgi:hypothetical protein